MYMCEFCKHCKYDPTSFTCRCCDLDDSIVFPDDEACQQYIRRQATDVGNE